MRKLFVFNMVSVDGYFAGTHGEIDWHNVDREFDDFSIEQLHSVGAIVFGRVTYEMMAGYWPTPQAMHEDPTVAHEMNSLPKIVFSKTLTNVSWTNSILAADSLEHTMKKVKNEPGRDIAIFGSGTIVSALVPTGLIDEYRFMVNPVVLGKGKSLFTDPGRIKLTLTGTRTFKNGNVLLTYTKEAV